MAIRTFMVPAGAPPLINRVIFRFTQALFDAVIRPVRSEARRQSILSLFAPVSLLVVLSGFLGMIGFGYMLALYGAGIKPMIRAFLFSGSALSTLGFESPGNDFWVIVLSAVEALTVMIIVALLIGYLPTIYSSYQQREQAVDNLDELTGAQPDGIKVVDAYVNIFGPSRLGELWQTWIGWFADLATSGSTLSGELYLRSSRWDRSWICAAGAMLDAAALVYSSVDLTTDPAADRLVRLGSRSLRQVLEPLGLRCPDQPKWPRNSDQYHPAGVRGRLRSPAAIRVADETGQECRLAGLRRASGAVRMPADDAGAVEEATTRRALDDRSRRGPATARHSPDRHDDRRERSPKE